MKGRKVVQISTNFVDNNYNTQTWMMYTALCDDGTMWTKGMSDESWYQLPDVPQPELDSNIAAERGGW